MADRTAAGIFGEVFEALADPTFSRKKFAKELLELSKEYDFTPDQMGADDALIKLKLVKTCKKHPEVVIWFEEDGCGECEYEETIA